MVIDFYTDDDISAMMPGKKDVIVTRNKQGDRIEIQKRLLLGTLREIYATFKQQHGHLNVGFAKFSLLRPPQCVFVRSCGTHTVCMHYSPECQAFDFV